jgi:DNA-binding transcriptional MerR regulator/mannose-6-phosphate isomerase-like protein (cupin superfamily)
MSDVDAGVKGNFIYRESEVIAHARFWFSTAVAGDTLLLYSSQNHMSSPSSGKKDLASRTAEARPGPGGALKIGVVARQLGISASMLRAWEKLGLANPRRTDSRYRIYTSEDRRVLRRAIYLRRVLGLNGPAILNQLRQEGLLPDSPAAPNGGQVAMVGLRFRKLRLNRGESLSEVAKAADISVGFLSNLERSQTSASVAVMRRLAEHFGVNILDLFNGCHPDGEETAPPLVKPGERKVLQGGEGVRMELLAWGKIIMEPHLFRVAPGGGSRESYSHFGEEFLFVIRGQLVIFLDEKEFRLKAGDSFYFESKTPHRWFNPGRTDTSLLWINTPPTF